MSRTEPGLSDEEPPARRVCRDCQAPLPRAVPWCRRCFAVTTRRHAASPVAVCEDDVRGSSSVLDDVLPILVVLVPGLVIAVLLAIWLAGELIFVALVILLIVGLVTIGAALT